MKLKEKIKQNRRIYMIVSVSVCALLIIAGSLLLAPIIVRTVNDPEQFRTFITEKGAAGYIIFIFIQILQVVFAFIPGEIVEVGAGYAFGPIVGLILCLIGVFIASSAIFFAVRKFGHSFALAIMDSSTIKQLNFLKDNKKLGIILFILYFLPGTPKDVLTYFAGLTDIKPTVFLLICTLGRIPSVITSTVAGNCLIRSEYEMSLIVFGITSAIAVVGYFIYVKISSLHSKKNAKNMIGGDEENN